MADGVFRACGSPNADYASPALAEHALGRGSARGSLRGIPDDRVRRDFESGSPGRLVTRRAPGERFFALRRAHGGPREDGLAPGVLEHRPAGGPHRVVQQPLHVDPVRAVAARRPRLRACCSTTPGAWRSTSRKADPRASCTRRRAATCVFYVFAGPTPRDVLDRYTALTGRTPMPPLWALGNQQSRWSYMSADEVRAIAGGVPRARDPVRRALPRHRLHGRLPGLHVGRGALPGPGGADRGAGRAGLPGRHDRRSGREGGRGLPALHARAASAASSASRATATSTATSSGPGCARSRTSPTRAVREWWGDQHRVLLDEGVAGVWCDMNEPALFVPAAVDDAGRRRAPRRRPPAAARRGPQRVRAR